MQPTISQLLITGWSSQLKMPTTIYTKIYIALPCTLELGGMSTAGRVSMEYLESLEEMEFIGRTIWNSRKWSLEENNNVWNHRNLRKNRKYQYGQIELNFNKIVRFSGVTVSLRLWRIFKVYLKCWNHKADHQDYCTSMHIRSECASFLCIYRFYGA